MQYSLRNIPTAVDRALRRRAREEGKSLNEVAIDALRRGIGAGDEPVRYRDLGDLSGTWLEDPEFDAAMAEQHRVDPHLWE
jgi:plasmid stability protein